MLHVAMARTLEDRATATCIIQLVSWLFCPSLGYEQAGKRIKCQEVIADH